MKNLFFGIISILFLSLSLNAQTNPTEFDSTANYKLLLIDGNELFVKIISSDDRELYVLTEDDRKVYIPQYQIKKIEKIDAVNLDGGGKYIEEDPFATRYFLTTNALPMKKGEHYVQWNIYGPDFQFAVSDKVGVGIMSSWIGVPIVGNIKYTLAQGENAQLAIGLLAGTGSWTVPDFGMALPFVTASLGDRRTNLAISAGYGFVWVDGNLDGRALMSIAGMRRITPKISLVFDSFILLPSEYTTENYYHGSSATVTKRRSGFAILIPGLRWHNSPTSAFQFGFTGIFTEGKLQPFPIPMAQWYRRL